jgi:SAM-dependent methyltransferase
VSQTPPPADPWSDYWAGADPALAAVTGGAAADALAGVWDEWLARLPLGIGEGRLLDLACGSAPVARAAAKAGRGAVLACSDYSAAALARAAEQFSAEAPEAPAVFVAADAARPPFSEQGFDLVASQFGLEYAGEAAFAAAAGLVAPEGALACLVHLAEGPIHRECAGNLSVMEAIVETGVIGRTRGLIDLARTNGPETARRAGEDALVGGFRAIEAAANASPGAAAGFAMQLVPGLARLYSRWQAFAPEDADHWLEHQARAVAAYRARMAAMADAARDTDAMTRIIRALSDGGLVGVSAAPLTPPGRSEPLAWRLEAHREPLR